MRYRNWILIAALTTTVPACYMEQRIPAEMTSLNKSQPAASEKSLSADVRFDIGSLEVAAEQGSDLYAVDLDYDKASYEPEISYEPGEEGRLSFRLQSMHKIGIRSEPHQNRLRLNLTGAIPVKLDINSGVGDARLSLSGLKIAELDLESGVGGSRISSYQANPVVCERIRIKNGVGSMDAVGLGNLNFRELEFEGGVGGANLDFTGEWGRDVDIRVQVGVGGVTVRMPRDIGVRVEAEKHFLSGLHLEGFTQRDSLYYSENYDKARHRASVRVATGVGGFRINWI